MNENFGGIPRPPTRSFCVRSTVTFPVSEKLHFRLHATLIYITLLIFSASVSASGQAQDPLSQYRVLEWKELVPEGWEPPLVPDAYDEIETSKIDKTSVVPELDQQLAALPGYMKPVVFEGNQVSEFILVPFLPFHTRQHAHLDANQMVYVYLLEPVQVNNPLEPLWVVGTITLEAVMTDEGPAAYRIVDGVITEYEY